MTAIAISCSAKAEQKALPVDVQRMMGLELAAELLGGKPALAEALGISGRALRHKLTADRGISNFDVLQAAKAVEALASRADRLVENLRSLIVSRSSGE